MEHAHCLGLQSLSGLVHVYIDLNPSFSKSKVNDIYNTVVRTLARYASFRTWRSEVFFQKGRNSGFFQVVLVNFHFIHSKLRKQPFLAKRLSEKCQIPKYRGEKSPLTSFRRPWFYVLIEATNIFYSPRCQQCTKVTL